LAQNQALERTTRMNLLLDFYAVLLTEKQHTFLQYYYHDDFTLGEIAEINDISRQAVFEHIKRAGNVLEDYEAKLQLLAKHQIRHQCFEQIKSLLAQVEAEHAAPLRQWVQRLEELE
jgi:predicted DNA-binding protein YlxM (UPF0122 family)